MDVWEVLSRLHGVKGQGKQFYARCPAHDDQHQSLSVSTGDDGRILLKCQAGCSFRDVVAALGLKSSDMYPQRQTPQAVEVYDYGDCQKLRKPGKKFTWRRPDGKGGWIHDRKGIPYHLYIAGDPSGAVYLAEGEKDANTLQRLGFCGASGMDGAGPGKWKAEYTAQLKGKVVYILQDNDEKGRAYAQETAAALHGVCRQVKVFDLLPYWPAMPEHADITDFALHVGDTRAREVVRELTGKTPVWRPDSEKTALQTMSARELQDADLPPVVFIVEKLLTTGLALLAAPPKYGKSWMVLDLCLSVATGAPFLGYSTTKGECLYLALEDSAQRLQSRINKVLGGERAPMGFDCATKAGSLDGGLLEQLEGYADDAPNLKLVVIDTLQKVRGATKDKNAYGEDYRIMGDLKAFADKRGVCVLLVHHLRKMRDDTDPFNMIAGTTAINGAADTAIVLSREKRGSDRTAFTATGRDIQDVEAIITFDRDSFHWKLLGDAVEMEERRAREEYQSSPIVRTIKKLLEQGGGTWTGTMGELMTAGRFIAQTYLADTTQALTRRVRGLEKPLFEYDGIMHQQIKNGSGGSKHKFFIRGSEDTESPQIVF